MAKITSLFGTIQGKVSDVVMSVRNGQQIVRKYQPVVFNPSTPAQVEVRAKLKLLSQLSQIMANVIAIPREGLKSPRNLFTKINYPITTFTNAEPGSETSEVGTAAIDLTKIQITKSRITLPELTVSGEQEKTIALSQTQYSLDRVIYNIFNVQPDNTLRFTGNLISSSGPNFETTVPLGTSQKYVVYAYGMKDLTQALRTKFDDINFLSATLIANIVSNHQLSSIDYQLTETKSAVVNG